jgi:hypothetical protein
VVARLQAVETLGRGLEALLGESRREEPLAVARDGGGQIDGASAASGLAMVAVSDIVPHPANRAATSTRPPWTSSPPRSRSAG